MDFTDQQYIVAGEMAHYLSLFLNMALTSAAMLGLPTKDAYDSWWTSHGFCVIEENAAIPTEILCCLFLIASAIATFVLSKSDNTLKDANPLLAERLQSSVFANAAHGLGHLFGWFMGLSAPPIELSLEPAAVANLIVLTSFWGSTLRTVVGLPMNSAMIMSVVVLAAQYLLDVPSELAFTYSQSVILFASSVEQLRRKDDYSKNHKYAGEFLFFAYALYNLPVFALYPFEMFLCSNSFLTELGGHAIYDLYLALAPFMLYYAVIAKKKSKGE